MAVLEGLHGCKLTDLTPRSGCYTPGLWPLNTPICEPPSATAFEETLITVEVLNLLDTSVNFLFTIEASYEHWQTGEMVVERVFETQVRLAEPAFIRNRTDVAFGWVPKQAGLHTLTVSCGEARFDE